MSKPGQIRSDIAWSNRERIVVRGKDLPNEVLGHFNLGDFAFLQITGKAPTPQQSRMFNAVVVALVEHGLTPSAIAARMTYAGAPESMQAAIAAGLCGLGTVFVGSTEGAARMLYDAISNRQGRSLQELAQEVVAQYRKDKRILPGMGHPLHKPVDPRAPRLFAIARECGMDGDHVKLMQMIADEAEKATGKSLPVNATGAIGAISCEFGFDWRMVRGLGVMARAIGLVGHLMEEANNPMAFEIWRRVEEEGGAHMREPSTPYET